jgi:uncharacterized protein YbgA (DUF1722 family)
MGRLVADAGKRQWDELAAEYGAMLMEGLSVMGRRRSGRGQARQRPKGSAPAACPPLAGMGFLKNHLSSPDKQEPLGLIEETRQGLLPLIGPLT